MAKKIDTADDIKMTLWNAALAWLTALPNQDDLRLMWNGADSSWEENDQDEDSHGVAWDLLDTAASQLGW
jgi:hypothetical protein